MRRMGTMTNLLRSGSQVGRMLVANKPMHYPAIIARLASKRSLLPKTSLRHWTGLEENISLIRPAPSRTNALLNSQEKLKESKPSKRTLWNPWELVQGSSWWLLPSTTLWTQGSFMKDTPNCSSIAQTSLCILKKRDKPFLLSFLMS